ncbi:MULTISPECIES: hypothetical protein [unclassified Herbaspirillum]|uniref:hypothetical protein n=1 Tax=unclassified Herbaspirillum TaxID=2624150 RepID=UPI00161D9795|nr:MULTISPECIES: hypothetical protein [unclassified Herbaspirillum]MBB5392950.1 hypothetical protein [Herbaspirillum sp. SJZ102]
MARHAEKRHRGMGKTMGQEGLISVSGDLKSKKAVSAGLRPKPETAFKKRFSI